MITSCSRGHAHLWYHVPYRSIENVWETANEVSVCKHCVRATEYHDTILDIGSPEMLLQGDTFHVRIREAVAELWRRKRLAVGNVNVPRTCGITVYNQFFSELTTGQQFLHSTERDRHPWSVSWWS